MLAIIVAIDKNGLIGKGNALPWYYKKDLAYFREITLNKTVVMGYNTYLSIYNRIGKLLPNRENYVFSYETSLPGNPFIVNDIDEVLKESSSKDIFVIGGKMIYEMFLPLVEYLYITHINKTFEGNVYFPKYNLNDFELIKEEKIDELTFAIYKRIK